MMFSNRVRAFLKANEPKRQVFSVPTSVSGLRKTKEEGKIAFTSYGLEGGYETILLSPEKEEIIIEWSTRINMDNPTKVVYEPFVSYECTSGGSSRGAAQVESPREKILKHFEVTTKEVTLPEVVVQIPLPEWAKEEYDHCGDWPNVAVVSEVCFASEAKQMVSEFREKLGRIEEDLEKGGEKKGKKFFLKEEVPYCKKCGEKIKLIEEFDEIQQCWIMRISCGDSCVKFYQDYHENDISEGGLLSYLKNSGFFEEV